MNRMYDDLAPWWPLLSAPGDYEEEAAIYARLLLDAGRTGIRTVLELGSGGGNNASHMKASFELTLVEPAAGMLEVSRRLNPACEHVRGDMREIRLGRAFDGVFIHDAIDYMTTRDDLRAALDTAFAHLRPGGALLVCPDHVRETFRPATTHGGHDAPDGRGVRFVEWTWDPDSDDETCVTDYAFLLRDPDGAVRSVHDRHVHGLFREDVWLEILAGAGFEDVRVAPITHSELEPGSYQAFTARRPA